MKLIERIRKGKDVIDEGTGFRCPYCGTRVHPYYMIFGENELRFCYACGKKIAIEVEPARPRVNGRWAEYRVKLKGTKDVEEPKKEKTIYCVADCVYQSRSRCTRDAILLTPSLFCKCYKSEEDYDSDVKMKGGNDDDI